MRAFDDLVPFSLPMCLRLCPCPRLCLIVVLVAELAGPVLVPAPHALVGS
jgi:hypothetical protein